jgi:hypothetical protein
MLMINRLAKPVLGGFLIVMAVSACSSSSSRVASVATTAEVQASASGYRVNTVESLARASSVVAFGGSSKVLGVVGEVQVMDLQLAKVFRGDTALTHVMLAGAPGTPPTTTKPQSLVFLRAVPMGFNTNAELEAKYGQLYSLAPSSNSVMVVNGNNVVTSGDGLSGLRDDPKYANLPAQAAPGLTKFKEFVLADVLAVVSDRAIGPTETIAPTPEAPAADKLWISDLDGSCRDARPLAAELKQLLTDAATRGTYPEGAAARAIDILKQLRVGRAKLANRSGISSELTKRWAESERLLDQAAAILVTSQPLSGKELTQSLASFSTTVTAYQLQWSGLDAVNCKQFD